MREPRAADLFCGAGGAAQGLMDAGFEVHGFDTDKSLLGTYPGHFRNNCVSELNPMQIRKNYDFVWASPPCQAFSVGTLRWPGRVTMHEDWIKYTRWLLEETKLPYVIENVPRAPIRKDLMLCGQMFGLGVLRHRHFEANFPLRQPLHYPHVGKRGIDYFTVAGHPGGYSRRDRVRIGSMAEWSKAMGIDWMTSKQIVEAVPPAYAKYIGLQFLLWITVP